MGKIKTRGIAEGKAIPDRCRYSFEINENANTTREAARRCTNTTEEFLKAVRNVLPDLSAIKFDRDSSSHLNTSGKETYYARRYLKADLPFDMHLHSQLEAVIAKANLNVGIDTNMYYSKEEELRQNLLKEAVLNSKRGAEIIAQTQGQRITGIDKVNLDDDETSDWQKAFGSDGFLRVKAGDAGGADLLLDQLTAKELIFSAYVDVIWNSEPDVDKE